MFSVPLLLKPQLAKYNITVNAVEPGYIMTEGLKVNTQQVIEERTKPIPMGHLGTPEETAYAHLFLASDEAGYIRPIAYR